MPIPDHNPDVHSCPRQSRLRHLYLRFHRPDTQGGCGGTPRPGQQDRNPAGGPWERPSTPRPWSRPASTSTPSSSSSCSAWLTAGRSSFSDDELSDPARFWETIRQTRGTPRRPGSLPSPGACLSTTPPRARPLAQVLLGGEAVLFFSGAADPRKSPEHIQYRQFLRPHRSRYRLYRRLPRAGTNRHASPFGKPMPNYRAYILDAHGQPVPIGVPGELCIGWRGTLARGYLNRPGADGGSLHSQPLWLKAGLYKTGDLARWL